METKNIGNAEQVHLENLLELLKPEKPEELRTRLIEEIFFDTQLTAGFPSEQQKIKLRIKAALNGLIEIEQRALSKDDAAYKKLMSKIGSFLKNTQELRELFEDPHIQKVVEELGASVYGKNHQEKCYDYYFDLYEKLERAQNDFKRFLDPKLKPGRPELKGLNQLVSDLIDLYEELSGNKFTILRYPETMSDPSTPGHQFVHEVIMYVNDLAKEQGIDEIYTGSSIYNSCEKAQKTRKTNNPD